MVTAKSTEARLRLLPSPYLDPSHAARTRDGLLCVAREAVQLARADRNAGNRASAARWLTLAAHLRATACALTHTTTLTTHHTLGGFPQC